jgi:IS5 family transposase
MQANLLLFPHQQLLHEGFLLTDVGKLYQSIPFEALANQIEAPKRALSGKGCKPWFDVQGAIGLLILKHYLCCSDEMLIERINTDWSLQLFCGIQLHPGERIKDTNLPSAWRGYIGRRLDIDELQKQLVVFWKPYMEQTNIGSQDATCYESRIAHPTDIKLLWKCCHEVHMLLQRQRKLLRLRKSRNNYDKQKKQYLWYQKSKKKTKRQERKLRKKLLKYLLRLTELQNELQQNHGARLSIKEYKRMQTIIKVYEQQHHKAYGDPKVPIKDRIVSLSKPYIRPIVRGKEIKAVEFGAKVNKLQVDGISFIERFSYDAFNEGTCYQDGIYLQRKFFGKCTHHSADAIYATNANRKYSTQNNIVTNFIPKGRQKEQDIEAAKIMRGILNKERGTRLEGSFGNEKNHYLLQKVNARNQYTELCWIFFGILTANASIITERKMKINQATSQTRAA